MGSCNQDVGGFHTASGTTSKGVPKMLARSELENEFEQDQTGGPGIRVRYVRGPHGEFESEPGIEAFLPSPPTPGTTLPTNFPFGGAAVSRLAASAAGSMPGAPFAD